VATENYHVFGVGLGTDDLRYIGWTRRSVDDEEEQIVSDLVKSGDSDIAHSVCEATNGARISIFEIESVPSIKDAMNSASCWCDYFNSLGLHVTCAHSGEPK
jgi:hypothetical protein